jgi:hypothetical protein
MSDDATFSFASAIQDHLELKRRNASLEFEMPLARYLRGNANDDGGTPVSDTDATYEDEDTVANVRWPE